jgi:hypothetical protein
MNFSVASQPIKAIIEFSLSATAGLAIARSVATTRALDTCRQYRRERSLPFISTCGGSVAAFKYPGIPWRLYLRRQRGDGVHFWPFDAWNIP